MCGPPTAASRPKNLRRVVPHDPHKEHQDRGDIRPKAPHIPGTYSLA